MEIKPIAWFESPFPTKFGIPRQSGLAPDLTGRIVFAPEYRQMEAIRGLDAFDYLWIIWEFSANRDAEKSLTVRPPRLGGNQRMGVFATRSPFRPNNLGLSCVRIDRIDHDAKSGPVIYVKGADLMHHTPIYDIKPYVAYADAHPDARSGFVDNTEWQPLQVEIPSELIAKIPQDQMAPLISTLEQDPRPRYHHDPDRIYGMPFLNLDIRFKVAGNILTVVEVITN